MKIAVVVNWISYKKGRLQLGLSDWSNVEFHYDCDKQQFVVSSVKLAGYRDSHRELLLTGDYTH